MKVNCPDCQNFQNLRFVRLQAMLRFNATTLKFGNLTIVVYPSSQNLSLKYLSPESQRIVTITAGSLLA